MKRMLVTLGALAMLFTGGAFAAGGGAPLKDVEISDSNEARQRGATIVIETCMLCHSLQYVKYQDLKAIGMTAEQIEEFLSGQEMTDRMMSVIPVEDRKESYGLVPPDLSLMAIARAKGPQYIYSLLTDYYYNEKEEVENHVFPGIKMPDVFSYADTAPDSSERADIEAQAKDLVAFLVWTADPNAESRRTIGAYVILYLIIMTALLYLVKRRVWRNVEGH